MIPASLQTTGHQSRCRASASTTGVSWCSNWRAHSVSSLAAAGKVIQMDRRVHALQGMDRLYMHVTRQLRERLREVPEELWQDALAERYTISPHSDVPW